MASFTDVFSMLFGCNAAGVRRWAFFRDMTIDRFQAVEVSDVLEISSTSGWEVRSHFWALEQFSGLEVVVFVRYTNSVIIIIIVRSSS